MVVVCSSETLVSAYKSTRRHNPDKLFSTFDFYSVQLLYYLKAGEEAPRKRTDLLSVCAEARAGEADDECNATRDSLIAFRLNILPTTEHCNTINYFVLS
jgi:hypothetical protein